MGIKSDKSEEWRRERNFMVKWLKRAFCSWSESEHSGNQIDYKIINKWLFNVTQETCPKGKLYSSHQTHINVTLKKENC